MAHSSFFKIRYLFLCILVTIIAVSVIRVQPKNTQNPSLSPSAPAVTIAQVIRKTVSPRLSFPATLVSLNVANLKARIEGQVIGIHFEDGELVKKDQLLFTLDDYLLQTQLAQAEGSLARDKANLHFAESEVKRNKILAQRNIASESKLEQAIATADSNRGSVQVDQAMIDQYKVQISYTKILSPIEGKIGFRNIDIGSIVRPTDEAPLVTIAQLNPIEVHFSLPERYLPFLQAKDPSKIEVEIMLISNRLYPYKGYIKSINNQIDTSTGSILVSAQFPNPNLQLLPGQYVKVELSLEKSSKALIVPINAIQIGQTSSYVYVYQPENKKVHHRPIVSEALDDKAVEIKKGVKEGEFVITSGHLKLKDNMEVRIVGNSPPEIPTS
jgi:multidrug efflux system membrane fusion protein